MLMSRLKRFEPGSGHHKLFLSIGGSVGHSSEWVLDIDEGWIDDGGGGRTWDSRLTPASDAVAATTECALAETIEQAAKKRTAKDIATEKNVAEDAATALAKLKFRGPSTVRDWKDSLRWDGTRINRSKEQLIEQGAIRTIKLKKGNGQEYDAWEATGIGLFEAST
jgi:hypothetical protein